MIVAGIPAYNEEKTIAKVILLAQRYVDLVVVCDDGSQDLTKDIAQKLGAIVIIHEKNMGYGAAIQSLLGKARALNADLLLTIDADGQHDAGDIPKMLQPILENKADIVIGSRFLQVNTGMPTYRRFGIKVLTKVTNGARKERGVTDAQCGLRAYNMQAIERLDLHELGMGISAEIVLNARNQNLRIAEVPVNVHYHDLETSTHHPVRHGLDVLSTIIRLVVEERPLFFLGLPGIFSLFIGVLFALWAIQIYTIEHYLVTNILLTSIVFTLIGIFTVFTAITLYAVVRLTQKLRPHDEEKKRSSNKGQTSPEKTS
jgi:glycosyltransferase involved in cell wall biosynthesis